MNIRGVEVQSLPPLHNNFKVNVDLGDPISNITNVSFYIAGKHYCNYTPGLSVMLSQ